MWTVCITSIRHVLKLNGYGGPQAKANEKRLRFKGWETLVTNSLTHRLRILNCCFYFTIPPKFSLRSSENIGHEVGKKPLILAFHVSCSVYF